MRAIIEVEVPDHQIGQEVSIYFKDTMMIKGIVQELSGDLISSQLVKDKYKERLVNNLKDDDRGIDLSKYAEEPYKAFCKFMDSILSVNSQEPKWIPISERLPEEKIGTTEVWNQKVLVTAYLTCDEHKKLFVTTEFIENVISKEDIYDKHIVAWMPLPEPYKTESEDKE